MTGLIAVESKVMNNGAAGYENFFAKWIKYVSNPASVKAYTKGVKNFFNFCKGNGISSIDRDVIQAYREYLNPAKTGAKYKASTANLYLTATKLFCGFLYQERIIEINVAERIKNFKVSEQHTKDALSASTTKRIITSFDIVQAEIEKDTALTGKKRQASIFKNVRDKAIYAIMTCCGLRCVEVQRANKADLVNRGEKTFLQVQGKGRDDKAECVEVPSGVLNLVNQYLAERGVLVDDAPLFASVSRRNFGGRLTTNSISRIIKGIFRANGIDTPRITAHSLRHTCANTMILNNVDLRRVQEVLRHRNITVTQRYLHELDRYNNGGECVAAAAFGL